MMIEKTYPILTVRWLAIHGLVVPTPTLFWGQYKQSNAVHEKPNLNERAMTQSSPHEQNN